MHLHIFEIQYQAWEKPSYSVVRARTCPSEEQETKRYLGSGAKGVQFLTTLAFDSVHANFIEVIRSLSLADCAFDQAFVAGARGFNTVVLIGSGELPLTLTFEEDQIRLTSIPVEETERQKQSASMVTAPIKFSEAFRACEFLGMSRYYFDVCYALWFTGRKIAQDEAMPTLFNPVFPHHIEGAVPSRIPPLAVLIHLIKVRERGERTRVEVVISEQRDFRRARYFGDSYELIKLVRTLEPKDKKATLLHILHVWEVDLSIDELLARVWRAGEKSKNAVQLESGRKQTERLRLHFSRERVELEGRRLLNEKEWAYGNEHLFDFLEKSGQTGLFLELLHDLWLDGAKK